MLISVPKIPRRVAAIVDRRIVPHLYTGFHASTVIRQAFAMRGCPRSILTRGLRS